MAKLRHFTKKAIFSLAQIVDQNAPQPQCCEIIVKMLQTFKVKRANKKTRAKY